MNKKIFKPIIAALFAAIICVTTFIIQIPTPMTGGYINLGDGFILLSGVILGPVYGFLASAIGSALADIMFGYVTYVPATFIIKGCIALIISLACSKKFSSVKLLVFGVVSEFVMVAGYFIYECFVLSYGIGALASVAGNILQGICGIAICYVMLELINKNVKLKNILKWRE